MRWRVINKRKLGQINKELSENRDRIRFQTSSLQKNMVEQLELSLCKMFEYIKDESDFLKTYINELRNIEQNDFSAIFLDSLEERIRKNKQRLAAIRVAYEEAKISLGINNDLDELDILSDKVTRVNEIIQSLEKIEKILFSYPIEN